MTDPDLNRIRQLIAYDPIKGTLTWLPMVGDSDEALKHNARHAGTDAVHAKTTEGWWVVVVDHRRYPAEQVAFYLASGVWTDVRRIDWNAGIEPENLELDGISVTAEGRYEASVWKDHRLVPLGSYASLEAAAEARAGSLVR